MENRVLTEKESLELIARMIKETQSNVARYAAYPLLIWGYLTTLIALVVWYVLSTSTLYYISYLWFALPLIGWPFFLFYKRKEKVRGVSNYVDRVTGQIWIVFGSVGLVVSLFAFVKEVNIYFIIPLLMGIAVTLSGCVSKYRPMIFCGTVGIALSFLILLISGVDRILIFAAIFVVMMIIPGHILNKKVKQEYLKNV